MLNYIIGRIARMVPQVILISILAFIIIQLPPGDYLTSQMQRLQATGVTVDKAQIELLTKTYGLDQPMYVQYIRWIWNIVTKFDKALRPRCLNHF